MQLLLSDQESSLLLRVVRNRLQELRGEVHHSHDSEARRYLLHKERLLNNILDRFPEDMDEHAHMAGFERETSDVVS
ncbi:MAG TPA: hypothetical protein VLB51_15615 [Methylomirabilota bacterium]|nr:hypothetical protein [Methylomirabilota bacterium]